MKKTLISESTIRELIKEAFETPPAIDIALVTSKEELPVIINPSTDNSLASVELSPINVEFVPRDTNEFCIAIKQMAKNLPEEIIPTLYAKVRELMMDEEDKTNNYVEGDTEDMEKRERARLGTNESFRLTIRKMIQEALDDKKKKSPTLAGGFKNDEDDLEDDLYNTDPEGTNLFDPEDWEKEVRDDEYYKGFAQHKADVKHEEVYDEPWEHEEEQSDWDPEPVATPAKKTRNVETGYGVEGDQLRKMADKLGISTAGAKRLMTTGLGKLKYLSQLSNDEVKDLVSGAVRQWVEKLVDAGRLDDKEGMLWIKHPEIVASNGEFRDFLHNVIRDEMTDAGEWVYQKDEETGTLRTPENIEKSKKAKKTK